MRPTKLVLRCARDTFWKDHFSVEYSRVHLDELVIEANVLGLGGAIESAAEKEARAAWPNEFAFLTRWLEKLEK